MKKIISLLFLILIIPCHAKNKVVGWIENIKLQPEGVTLRAKLDTGAKMSSIDASKIKHFTRHDQEWVRFTVRTANGKITLEKPIIGDVKVKMRRLGQKILGRIYNKRPVVRMQVCLAGEQHHIKVNLADRKHFLYPFLVGRTDLATFHAVVDPKSKHTIPPIC